MDFVPYGQYITRFTDVMMNRVLPEVFGDGGDARSTKVFIYNHTEHDLYLIATPFFESGGVANDGRVPYQITRNSVEGYKVVSHGFLTGVTGADVRYGFNPGDQQPCLWIVTSNPYIGDVSSPLTNRARVESMHVGVVQIET
jgi:hypothetical protein